MEMEKELKQLLCKRKSFESGLKKMDDEIKKIKDSIITEKGQNLFKSIVEFSDLFKTGAVHDKFKEIKKQLAELKVVDESYLHTIGTAEPYGMVSDNQVVYIVSYLLGSAWREDSDIWKVLGQISDTIDIVGNPFAGGE